MATPEPVSALIGGMISYNGLLPLFGTTGSLGLSENEKGSMYIPSHADWLTRFKATTYKTNGPTGAWKQEWWSVHNFLLYGGSCHVGATATAGPFFTATINPASTPLHSPNKTIDVVFDGSNKSSALAASNIAKTRRDCLAFIGNNSLIPTPNGYTGGTGLTMHFRDFGVTASSSDSDTEYVSFFAGRKLFYDDVSISPSADPITISIGPDVAGCLARTVRTNNRWTTPAGTTRGKILNFFIPEQSFSETDLTNFSVGKVNPVIVDATGQLNLMGSRTGYNSATTSLVYSNLSSMLLINYVNTNINKILNQYVFEVNSSTIRLSITSQATSILDTILASGSISSYVFTCDSTNNTPTTIAAGQLVADLTIRQNNVISSIVLTFVVVLGA